MTNYLEQSQKMIVTIQHMMIIGISFAVSHMKYMGAKKYFLRSEIERKFVDHEGKYYYIST